MSDSYILKWPMQFRSNLYILISDIRHSGAQGWAQCPNVRNGPQQTQQWLHKCQAAVCVYDQRQELQQFEAHGWKWSFDDAVLAGNATATLPNVCNPGMSEKNIYAYQQ